MRHPIPAAALRPSLRPLALCCIAVAAAVAPSPPATAGSPRTALIQAEELRPESLPSDEALEAAGARIGDIQIDVGDVFETNRDATAGSFAHLVDRMHTRTREGTIRTQLLFYSGQRYVATQLRETERLLRRTVYLTDVSVYPVAYHDGVVDVRVKTRDVWTLNVGVSFGRSGGANSSGLGLEDLNLFGTGTRLSAGMKSDVDRDTKQLRFRDEQLFGSRFLLDAQVADNSDGFARSLDVQRPFYALDARRAGGVAWKDVERIDPIYSAGEIADRFSTRERIVDAWVGRSAGLRDGWARRYSIGLRNEQRAFHAIDGTVMLPRDVKLAYPWVGVEWQQDAFATTRNRETVARTEDVAVGWHLSARAGAATRALGSTVDAMVLDVAASRGFLLGERQMLDVQTSFSGRAGSSLNNAVAAAAARWYFRSSPATLSYAGLSVDLSTRLDADRQLVLGGDNGLRGYPLRYAAGSGRWLFTAEQRWFSDWYPFRLFNVGAAAFFDAGRAFGRAPGADPATQRLLMDAGIGLRLANSRSARANVLHIDIAFPMSDVIGQGRGPQLLIETRTRF